MDRLEALKVISEIELVQKKIETLHHDIQLLHKEYFALIKKHFGLEPQEVQGADITKLLRRVVS